MVRRARVVDLWIVFSNVVITVRRLIRRPGPATAGKIDPAADRDLPISATP